MDMVKIQILMNIMILWNIGLVIGKDKSTGVPGKNVKPILEDLFMSMHLLLQNILLLIKFMCLLIQA